MGNLSPFLSPFLPPSSLCTVKYSTNLGMSTQTSSKPTKSKTCGGSTTGIAPHARAAATRSSECEAVKNSELDCSFTVLSGAGSSERVAESRSPGNTLQTAPPSRTLFEWQPGQGRSRSMQPPVPRTRSINMPLLSTAHPLTEGHHYERTQP